jgi:hypothetical protein
MKQQDYFKQRVLTEKQIQSLRLGQRISMERDVFRNPEIRARAAESVRATYASGNYKKRSFEESSRIGKLARSHVDPQKMIEANRRIGKLRIGKENPPGPSAKGVGHWKAKKWSVRSPMGVPYEFINLNEFVRTHNHLFEPSDLVWKKSACRASRGLSMLFSSDGKNCSWHGWTAVASFEGVDLIARNIESAKEIG